jgi:hypothetical protein
MPNENADRARKFFAQAATEFSAAANLTEFDCQKALSYYAEAQRNWGYAEAHHERIPARHRRSEGAMNAAENRMLANRERAQPRIEMCLRRKR